VDVVKQASAAAANAYKEISGRDIEFDVEGTLSDEGWVSLWFQNYGELMVVYFITVLGESNW